MKNLSNTQSRRDFIQKAAIAAAAPLILGNAVHAFPRNKKLRHACIGVGGMGAHDFQQFTEHANVEIVAICDVDEKNLKAAAEFVPNARTYTDWRELLKKESLHIDSVNVTVPDHNHFAIAITAIRDNKHVYCQKPMCHDVVEVRYLTEEAVKKGVVTQLGTQVAATFGDRTAVQWIRQEVVGKIKHAYLCSNRSGMIGTYRLAGPRPAEKMDPPSHLHWENFIGTAPMRSYAEEIYHPAKWRTWQDFGTGWSGDIGCHIFDPVWKGLGLKTPTSVIARVQESWKSSPERRADTWPQSNHIIWQFPGNEMTATDNLEVEWFDGEFFPPDEVRKLYNNGVGFPEECSILIGTEGALLIPHGGTPVVIRNSDTKQPDMPLLKERNHYHHFVDACLGGEKTESHFAQSGPMTETVLLGTVAIRFPDQLLEWDAKNLKFPNYPAANKLLKRNYRKGWEVEGI